MRLFGITRPGLAWIMAVGFLLSACGQSESPGKPAPPAVVTVEKVVPGSFTRSIELTGSVEPTRVATLSSPAEGPVMECNIREGDAVKIDQVLLRIGRKGSASAELTAAREELQRQSREFDRIQSLVSEKALPAEQLDMARSNLENARAAFAQAQQVSSDYNVRAPWSGLVSRLHVADGKYVAPRAPLVDLFDPSSLVLRFQVPERYAIVVQEGDLLHARFDAFPKQSFETQVVRAYPELDRRLRQRTFEAALPLDTHNFKPGFFARIEMDLEQVKQAVTVPLVAITRDSAGQQLVYIAEAGKAVARPVETGFEQNGRVLIQQGLASGDAVIVQGIERISDGVAVQVANSDPITGENQ